ncbi:hypothetical protein VTL71DRAFT_1459 [Oculimacula yallundae]|uniref:Uncharacterized protein n=1 Tax=Oculimacula yallundae TaxID=86028 RepID=A0ABR4CAR9_9HELO
MLAGLHLALGCPALPGPALHSSAKPTPPSSLPSLPSSSSQSYPSIFAASPFTTPANFNTSIHQQKIGEDKLHSFASIFLLYDTTTYQGSTLKNSPSSVKPGQEPNLT